MNVGRNAKISASNIEAQRTLKADIKNDLIVESLQDTITNRGQNKGINLSLGIGTSNNNGNSNSNSNSSNNNKNNSSTNLGIGFSVGSNHNDTSWVNKQASLESAHSIDIKVGNKTTIDGAVINSTNDNLTLNTKKLEYKDIKDTSKTISTGFGLSTSLEQTTDKGKTNLHPQGQSSLTLKNTGQYQEQLNKATIGKGTLIVDGKQVGASQDTINTQENTQENNQNQENTKENTQENNQENALAGLNRDAQNSRVITKDQVTGALDTTLNIDNRVFTQEGRQQLSKDFKDVGKNLNTLAQDITDNNMGISKNP